MKIEDVVFDVYQGSIVSGIKLKALLSVLNEDQKEIYKNTIKEEIEKIKEKMEKSFTAEQAKEIIRSLNEF